MTRLIFIRHAESDYSIRDEFRRPLTESGIESAAKIPELFRNTEIHRIYSSPYVRVIDTILNLAVEKGVEIISAPDLKERAAGEWVEDFFSFAEKQWGDFNYKLPGGESLKQVQQRNMVFIKSIIEEHEGQTVVVGTHGTSLCTILNYFSPEIDFRYFKKVSGRMPMIIEMLFDGHDYVSMKELYADVFR